MSKSIVKAGSGLAGLALVLVILVAANVILGNLRVRADLTEEKLYTLSDGTRELLRRLDEPVTLKFFFSRSFAGVPMPLKLHARQVEDILHEYRIASQGKVTVENYDPKPDSDAEEAALRYGLSGQPVEMFGPPAYFGLVAVAGDVEGAIPVIDPRAESLLEYNITRLIYRVTHPEQPVIGVMSSLPVLGDAQPEFGMRPPERNGPWLAFREIQQDYDLRRVEMGAVEIPEDMQALILVQPRDLSRETLFAIDQFVLRGGHLLAFVDPLNVAERETAPDPMRRPQADSPLEPLFRAWGVSYAPDEIVADMKAVTRLGGAGGRVEESPVFLTIGPDHINGDDIVTAQLSALMLPFAGAFKVDAPDGLAATPLIESSDVADTVATLLAEMGSQAVNRQFEAEPMPLTMAVRLTGAFPTAFPGGPPEAADEDGEEEDDAVPPEGGDFLTEGKSTVILVADADLITDRFCVEELNFFGTRAFRPLNDNIHFFGNAVEQMAGSSHLIGIRSRGEFIRPFTRVDALEQEARRQWQEKEQLLVEKLQETRRQLSQLQSDESQGQQMILSPRQEAAIERFREEELRINRELKDVRRNLRRDIERLGLKVKIANITLMPLLIAAAGIVYGLMRRHKHRS